MDPSSLGTSALGAAVRKSAMDAKEITNGQSIH